MQLQDGRLFRVISSGIHNENNDGPDFYDARIEIDRTFYNPTTWRVINHKDEVIGGSDKRYVGHGLREEAIEFAQITPPFAAAVNTQFVPKTLYHQTLLNDNDKIELIVPITGG